MKAERTLSKHTLVKDTIIGLDKLDVHLLRQLLQGPALLPLTPNFRRSFRAIARALAVDEDTVRNRVKRLQRVGFIQNWSIMLNPNLLGLHQSTVQFDVPSTVSKSELISRLKLVPDVFMIINWYGSPIAVIFAYDTDYSMTNKIALIENLSNVRNLTTADILWPECKVEMSITDWKILRSLQQNPRRSYVSVANEVEVSTRTVERRLQTMIQEKVLFAMPSLNPKALSGTVLVSLAVGHSAHYTPAVDRKISKELDDYIWHMFVTTPNEATSIQHTWFSLALPSIAKAREILEWAEKESEVRDSRIELVENFDVLMQSLEHYLETKLDRTKQTKTRMPNR